MAAPTHSTLDQIFEHGSAKSSMEVEILRPIRKLENASSFEMATACRLKLTPRPDAPDPPLCSPTSDPYTTNAILLSLLLLLKKLVATETWLKNVQPLLMLLSCPKKYERYAVLPCR